MGRFTKMQVLHTIGQTKLLPLFYDKDVNTGIKLIASLYKGGARIVEFTSRGDFAFQVFGALVTESTARYPDMILGVGSVTDAASASLYMQLGANFVVAPVFRKDIAKVCNRRKVPFFPGCGSLTEIAKAEEYGCDIVKLFPAEHYGPKFIKAVKGPQPWTRIMPTGGVLPTQESIGPWLKAGATCLGMGSKLLVKTESGSYDFTKIEQLVSASLKIISECKKPGQ